MISGGNNFNCFPENQLIKLSAVSLFTAEFAVLPSFYRAMHFSANARSWDRMSSVCPSVRPSVCDVGDL